VVFPTTTLYAFLVSLVCATCSAHLILLVFIAVIIFGGKYKARRSCEIFSYCFLLRPNIFLSPLFLNTLSLCYSLNVKDLPWLDTHMEKQAISASHQSAEIIPTNLHLVTTFEAPLYCWQLSPSLEPQWLIVEIFASGRPFHLSIPVCWRYSIHCMGRNRTEHISLYCARNCLFYTSVI